MSQIVTINGRPLDNEAEPYLQIGSKPMRRHPTIINGQMVHDVNINGYTYPPAQEGCILYLPGLPGQGSKIWNRAAGGASLDGTITGAVWKRSPNGLWYLDFDGTDDKVEANSQFGDVDFEGQLFTIKFWFNMDSAKSASQAVVGIKPTTATNKGIQIFMRAQDGSIRCVLFRADNNITGKIGISSDTSIFSNDAWYQFILTHDGNAWNNTNTNMYLNAVSKGTGTTTISDTWQTNNNKVYIGCAPGTYPNAGVALLEVLDTEWTAAQGLDSYNREKHLFGV